MAESEAARAREEHWAGLDSPRIPPAAGPELPLLLRPIAAVAGRVIGGPPPNVIMTLARHGALFASWLPFAARLMPRGRLPRIDTELVILRVAWNNRCRYEWDHHVRMGRKAGLSDEEVARVPDGPAAGGWSDRRRALLSATDELHGERAIGDGTWAALREHLDDRDAIELCMLVGHYEMLAMTIASLGVQPEATDPAHAAAKQPQL